MGNDYDECDECGADLHINPVERPNVDWVKVICPECGHAHDISMTRIWMADEKTGGEDLRFCVVLAEYGQRQET